MSRFEDCFAGSPAFQVFSPGRVNLIGEHIDYCGGTVLPAAIDRGTTLSVAPRDDGKLRVYSTRFGETLLFHTDQVTEPTGQWGDYVAGVMSLLPPGDVAGADIHVSDNIASGGLSSSASFALGIAWTLARMAGNEPDTAESRMALARFCQRAENEFVGVPCGLMDQASIVLGGIIRLDCEDGSFEAVMPDFGNCRIVVMDTARPRTLAASGYATRVREIAELCQRLGLAPSSLCRDLPFSELDRALGETEASLVPRLRHVITEQQRVNEAFSALESGEMARFGELMVASHRSLRDDYEVTGDALDTMVELSLSQPGVLGARMTGAGFGGCAIALVEDDQVEAHNSAVSDAYTKRCGIEPTLLVANPSAGTRCISS